MIFAPNTENPYRIELFGNQIDSIRTFDIGTQRSIETVESVFIPPVKEIFILENYRENIIKNMEKDLKKATKRLDEASEVKQNMEDKFEKYMEEIHERIHISNTDMIVPYIPREFLSSVLNYFNDDGIVFIDEPRRVEERVKNIKEQFLLKYSHVLESGEVLPCHEKINYEYIDIVDDIKSKICITNTSLLKANPIFNPKATLRFSSKPVQSFHNRMDFLKEELNHYKYRGYKVIILSGTEERGKMLQSTLMDLGVESVYVEDADRDIKSSQVFITSGSINGGFEYSGIKFVIISDKEIYGSSKGKVKKIKKKSKGDMTNFSDLNIGDFVVHENHGIGQYEGIEQLNIQGIKRII